MGYEKFKGGMFRLKLCLETWGGHVEKKKK